jgi:hypothetical protein
MLAWILSKSVSIAVGSINVAASSSINGIITLNPDATTKAIDTILNNGGVPVASGATLTPDNVAANGTTFNDVSVISGVVQIDAGDALAFNGDTLNGGTLNIFGEIDSNGASLNNGATIVNKGHIDIVRGSLTIDPAPITNTGTVEVMSGSTLVLSGEAIINSVTTNTGTTNGIMQVESTRRISRRSI